MCGRNPQKDASASHAGFEPATFPMKAGHSRQQVTTRPIGTALPIARFDLI